MMFPSKQFPSLRLGRELHAEQAGERRGEILDRDPLRMRAGRRPNTLSHKNEYTCTPASRRCSNAAPGARPVL